MEISDLLKGAPDLMGGLKDLGLSDGNVSDLGQELGNQLGGDDGFDFTDLLSGLDADSFLGKLDVGSIAEKVGISPEIAQGAISLIAPKIAEFTGGSGGALGKLGGFAKSLFGKN